MALRPVEISQKTDEVPLTVCGRVWFQRVRHFTPRHADKLVVEATTKAFDEKQRREVETFDAELHSQLLFRDLVATAPLQDGEQHWRGLTPDILAMLVELPDDYVVRTVPETLPPADADGEPRTVECVAWDEDLARFLWTEAWHELYRTPLLVHAKQVLVTTQLRKEAQRGNLPGSFGA